MMTVEAERPTAVGSPVNVGGISSRCCSQPLSPGRDDDSPASPVSNADSSHSSSSDTSIHADHTTEATLTVSVLHTASHPSSSSAASPPLSPTSPEPHRRTPEPTEGNLDARSPKDRASPASSAGSPRQEVRQNPGLVPAVLPTPVKLTNFSIDAILKPGFGNLTQPSSVKKECKSRPLDVVNLIKGNNNNKSSVTSKNSSINSPHGIDHLVHGHKYLLQHRNSTHQQQHPLHPSQHQSQYLSRTLNHSHRSSFTPYHPQSLAPHPAHTSHPHHHHHSQRSPHSPTSIPSLSARFIYPNPALREGPSPPTNLSKSSRHHPYSHHHQISNNHRQKHSRSPPETLSSTPASSSIPGARSPGLTSNCGSSSSSSTGPVSPGACSSITSSSAGSPTYKSPSSSSASQNNSDARSLHSPGAPPHRTAASSTAKDSKTKADGKDPMVWPAWVYCTRYSDRPSSGPRARKLKKSKEKKVEEKRPRTAFTNEQLARLKKEFDENRYLTEVRRQDLAKELGLNESQIKIWFQNKRAKMKKAGGPRNGLAIQLMAQGLYNHSTVANEESDDQMSVSSGMI